MLLNGKRWFRGSCGSGSWLIGLLAGCVPGSPDGGSTVPVYNNTTDFTNGNASYLGSAACKACHPGIAGSHSLHGHAHQLTAILGTRPTYPAAGTAGVPEPPDGFIWADISYVIGGYLRRGLFVDQNGYVLTTGATGVDTQWNLPFAATGTSAGFVSYKSSTTENDSYAYACFVCHTTGPQPQSSGMSQFQDNRPGITGTWQEPGVQCEACHGPGARHVRNPANRDIFVDTSAAFCGRCHSSSPGNTVHAENGFIGYREQYAELQASGGHAGQSCTTCHDPHASAAYDTAGIRTTCTACHAEKTMGFHANQQYVCGDYVEELTCISCHMPLAGRSVASTIVGESAGRVGDVRTHVFRISTDPVDFTSMFAPDGNSVALDSQGRTAMTVDFVCLRCHNSDSSFPFRLTIKSAAEIAAGIHGFE
jgi:hypothetical protein